MSKARPTRTKTRFWIACLSVTALAASLGGGATAALAAAPTVFSAPSTPKSQHEVEVYGYVDPQGSGLTDCHFEYGPTESYGSSVPCTPAAPGTNETQEVTVSATQGQFKLSFEGESTTAIGTGSTVAGSNAITGLSVSSGVFFEGMEITGPGIPPGTKITSYSDNQTSFAVSQNLTATAEAVPLEANLPFDANPNAVNAALTATSAIGPNDVEVTGGPGDASGSTPYRVVFQNRLGGIDVEQLIASDGPVPLSGGTGVTVSTVAPTIVNQPVRARADISGLDPGATYHYRLSVTNGIGSATTEDRPLSPLPPAPEAPPSCGNTEFRVEQHATYLPDCRAYEMVSPLDKNGGDIIGEGRIVYPTADGETVAYAARTGFADTIGSGLSGRIQYMARRGLGGWSTRTITPTPNPAVNQAIGDPTFIVQFSDQMDKVGLYATDLPQRDDDIFLSENFYLMDTGTRALETVTRPLENDPIPELQKLSEALQPLWHSGDFGHVTFTSRFNFAGEVSGTTQDKVYDYTEGEARVAGILPDGSIPSKGAEGARPTEPDGGVYGVWRGDEISHDGSRIFFRSPVKGTSPPPQLYVRKDGTSTDWITESERTPSLGQASGVTFQWASEDGHAVIFSTATQLTDDDPGGGGEALYRYAETPDPASEANLTFLTRMGAPSLKVPLRVVGASDDASRLYLLGNGYNLYAWDEGDLRFIAGLEGSTALATPWGENEARVSADGRRLAFRSKTRLTSNMVETQEEGVGSGQMYVYDLDTHSLVCASCVKGGTTRFASYYEPRATRSAASISLPGKVAFMSEDGRHVFIDTKSALLAEDTNGTEDVYDYQPDNGTVELITSGHDPEPSGFSGASPSGSDVFIATRERLVAQDTDDLVDLYDVRTEGGYPAPLPVPAPCVGDGCRGPASPPPAPAGAASSTLIGRGNAAEGRKPAKRRCRKSSKRPKQRCARKNRNRPQPSRAGRNGGESR